jgi:hypothetical protein
VSTDHRMSATFGAITVLGTAAHAPHTPHGAPHTVPHTTPVATVRHAGRWWFTTSRRAAKVAMLRRDPIASLTLPAPTGLGSTLAVTGRCALIDPTDPASLLRAPAVAALPAVVRLLAEHATDVAGYLADARELPFDWSPIGRLLVAVDESGVDHHPTPAAVDEADDPADRAIPCVVGVRFGRLPCGVAGTFDGHRVRVGPLARPIDTAAGIAVMIDDAMLDGAHDERVRPSGRRGILVRGRIDDQHPVDDGSGDHSIGLTARSITRWCGFESTTRRFDPAA